MKNLRVLLVPFAIVGATIMLAPDAMARDQIDWSLSIGSPGYYPPPPVVVYRQPPTVYAPPPVVYTPRTVYPMVPPGVVYANPGYVYQYDYYRRPHHGHKHHWERRDRY